MKILLNSIKSLLFFLVIVTFAACGGSKSVVTYDNSVEYRNAVSLPPLKKPSQQKLSVQDTLQTSSLETSTVSTNELENQLEPNPLVVLDIEPNAETDEAEHVIEDSVITNEYKVEEQEVVENQSKTERYIVNARVIEPNSNSARLQIEEGFEAAWEYLSDSLKRSDITVYNKNLAAQRFGIGCADMEDKSQGVKRGGWSFFNRKSQKTEHCSLQLASTKSITTIAVLNRSGKEVAASAAKDLFARLINN